MSRKLLITLIILVVVVGGFFYGWFVWLPSAMEKEQQGEKTQPPTLFGKDDYKIETRDGEKFIVVDKVGLTAKVPDGWTIKLEGSDIPEPEYWVRLLSEDYEPSPKTVTLPGKGCSMSVMGEQSEEDYQKIKSKIETIKNTKVKLIDGPEEYKYEYEIASISNHLFLAEKPSETDNKFTKFIKGKSIYLPVEKSKILSITTSFHPSEEKRCTIIWQEFLENIVVK